MEVAPGAIHLERCLTLDRQRALVDECRALIDGDVPGYVPSCAAAGRCTSACCVLGGTGMAEPTGTSRPEATTTSAGCRRCRNFFVISPAKGRGGRHDHRPGTLHPQLLRSAEGRMGLHQDKDESTEGLAAGIPVVSVSLGDSARFLFGGPRRRDPVETLRSSRATDSCSVARRDSAITACRESSPAPRPRSSAHRPIQPDVPSVLTAP